MWNALPHAYSIRKKKKSQSTPFPSALWTWWSLEVHTLRKAVAGF
jgi:hypothetical protein